MNKSDAIALAAYFPSRRSIVLFIEVLNYLEEYFSDCDLYVGINPSQYAPLGIALLKQSKLNFRYLEVSTKLDAKSDASGFQAALFLIKQADTTYEIVYFMHLKGASLTEEYSTIDSAGNRIEINVLRNFLEIFKNRPQIEDIFRSDPQVGTFSHLLGKSRTPSPDVTSNLMQFDYPPFFSYLHFYTFYAARGSAVHNILTSAKFIFWNSNLAKLSDIYFFERDFTQMIWRQGFLPKCNVFTNLNDGVDLNDQVFNNDSSIWLKTH